MDNLRSSCPINFSLEIFGDQWSLLILRDLMFNGKNTYSEFNDSAEGISTNILAKRLSTLEKSGIIGKTHPPSNKKTIIYFLTDKGIDLIPVLLELIIWGAEHGSKNKNLRAWANEIKKDRNEAILKARTSIKENLDHKLAL